MKITLAAELRSSNFLMFWKAETFYRETPSAKKKSHFLKISCASSWFRVSSWNLLAFTNHLPKVQKKNKCDGFEYSLLTYEITMTYSSWKHFINKSKVILYALRKFRSCDRILIGSCRSPMPPLCRRASSNLNCLVSNSILLGRSPNCLVLKNPRYRKWTKTRALKLDEPDQNTTTASNWSLIITAVSCSILFCAHTNQRLRALLVYVVIGAKWQSRLTAFWHLNLECILVRIYWIHYM